MTVDNDKRRIVVQTQFLYVRIKKTAVKGRKIIQNRNQREYFKTETRENKKRI